MHGLGNSFYEDPEEYLQHYPILTKDIIRNRIDELKSNDLSKRRWFLNTSGGSTGEPVHFIQDWEFASKVGAIKLLFSSLIGREIGEMEVRLWGSERDITSGSQGLKAIFQNKLTNTFFLNAYDMSPEKLREVIDILNTEKPNLFVAYIESLYELARFSEREGVEVLPQRAVLSAGGTLYPHMRETMEKVFKCKVFNRYGTREVGDIACERPGLQGLWVAPWGNYIEIVDNEGNRVPKGTEGEILVTSLCNYAMPLIRYKIGDYGILSPMKPKDIRRTNEQVLESVLGRLCDVFTTKKGVRIDPGYFFGLLYFRDWIKKYQVIQKGYYHVLYKIVQSDVGYMQTDLEEISSKTKLIMGDDCDVTFEFVDEIAASASGKYRYVMSEVTN
jgi:phenylacetate-CoA ligase